jgi:hypothetical protein
MSEALKAQGLPVVFGAMHGLGTWRFADQIYNHIRSYMIMYDQIETIEFL